MKALNAKPSLSVIETQQNDYVVDHHRRDAVRSRIKDISGLYNLEWLIRQETIQWHGGIDSLPDETLIELLSRIERARECIVEGISFDDAGLIRDRSWIEGSRKRD